MLLPRYVWHRWLGPLAITILAILGILFLETLHRNIPDWLHRGTPIGTVLAYHLLLLPSRLPIALPAAVFVATIFTIGRLQQNQEILAMRNAGLSRWTIVRWLHWNTLAFSAILLLLHCVPFPIAWAEAKASAIWERTHDFPTGHHLTYDSHRGRLWLLGKLAGNDATSVFIVEKGTNGQTLRHIRAERATFRDNIWTLYGTWERDNSAITGNLQSPLFRKKTYPSFAETPREMLLAQRRVRDLSFRNLLNLLRPIPRDDPARIPYAIRFHSLLAGCGSAPIALLGAMAFTLTGTPRRGSLLAASQAMACLFIFFLLTGLCEVLGLGHTIPPIVAAWLPNAMAGSIGLYFLRCNP